ncbi:MAG: DNA replication/repair protein RecF [Anaerolineae bacterium]|nr:DNA replication/repair protein RecF [Anaerolineae bacterium]
MHLRHLSLTNVRLYARLELSLDKGLIVIQGDNAQGKTSLLEAVHVLATGRGLHTPAGRALIRWGAESETPFPYALLRALVQRRDGDHLIELLIQKGEGERLRKEVRVDHMARRNSDLPGQLMTVLFLPSDVALVDGAPSLRREFLDEALSQVDPEYAHALEVYAHALTQRNALLRQAAQRERPLDPDELALWDERLVPAGVTLTLSRHRAVLELAPIAERAHFELSGGREYLYLAYQPSVDASRDRSSAQAQLGLIMTPPLPDRVSLAEAFQVALRARRREELVRGMTLVGPHRDELRFLANGMDLGEYGSRGQQRTAVLALKLAQAEWMQARSHEAPILLLDEVLAELDPHRRRCLLERIRAVEQVFITTTDVGRLEQALVTEAQRFTVHSGVLKPL